ncbi:MAG: ABC transporter substrate-binding protein [Opitutaceae bacterium]
MIGLALGVLLACGCGRSGKHAAENDAAPAAESAALTRIAFQTDWYPQPEHGGFYQALERGFYREAGLDVTILPGGPRALVLQKLGMGQVQLAMWRSDDVTVAISRGVPLWCLAGVFQKSPQALMFRAEHPVRSIEDLEGRVVMAGAASVWVQLAERRHGIQIHLTPLTFSIAQFLQNPLLVQQCMVTSEPFQAAKAGAEVGTFMLDESGSAPYHAIIANRDWVSAHPEASEAFVRASLRGWKDFLEGDPTPAFAAIARLNPMHGEASMNFSRQAMLEHHLVRGDRPGETLGALDASRLEAQARLLFELGIAEREVTVDELIAPGRKGRSE